MKNPLLFIMIIFSINLYSQETWNIIHYDEFSVPTSNIFYLNQDEAWAIGAGDIAYTNDGGISWTVQYNKPDYSFESVFFIDNQTGWVVGWSEVLKTTDGGQNWILQDLPNPMGLDVESVFFLNQDTGWIAGSYKTVYYTEDGGDNWDIQHPYELGAHYFLYDIKFFDNMNGCAVGGKLLSPGLGFILTTINGGVDWTELYPAGSEEFIKVQYITIDILWACDRAGKLFKSIDGGNTWEIFEDSFGYLSDMHFFDGNNALAISSGYRIHKTNNAWQSWSTSYLGFFGDMNKFSFANDQLGLGVGNESLLKTEDGGESWKRLDEKFTNIDFFNEDIGYVVQKQPNSNPKKTIDGGYTWEDIELNLNGYIKHLDFISENTGFMINSVFELLKTFDAGDTWEVLNLPIDSVTYTDMQFINEDEGFLITHNSNFIKTLDGGDTWNAFIFDTVDHTISLYFLDENNGWVVGAEGFCGVTSDGGESWEAVTVGDNTLIDVWFTNNQNGFVLSLSGDVYRTDNGGYIWELLPIEANNPLKINFIDEENGWIICRNKVFYTEDNGNSWNEELSIDWMVDRISDFSRSNSGNSWICTQNGRIYYRDSFSDISFLQTNTDGLKCYPNPAKEKLHVVIDQPISKEFTCEVYSVGGLFFGNQKLEITGNNTFDVLLRNMPSGVYFLRVSDYKEVKTLKFIKD